MLGQQLTVQNPIFNNGESENDVVVIVLNAVTILANQRMLNGYSHPISSGSPLSKLEIPEFQGGARGEALLDWIATVDELLEFKQVSK